ARDKSVPPTSDGRPDTLVGPEAGDRSDARDRSVPPTMKPKDVAKIKILDPACGSGSFLLRAYQKFLDWHKEYYVKDGTEKHKKEIYQIGRPDTPVGPVARDRSVPPTSEGRPDTPVGPVARDKSVPPTGDWRLTSAERKRILINNIFGVDIDPQAVEVTKLSLLLKVLEGESEESLKQMKLIYKERALPDLASNIKCGNSLIAFDFYSGEQMDMFDEEQRYRINAFDWVKEFPEIFRSATVPEASSKESRQVAGATSGGGFDVVIGNPPYIPIESMSTSEKEYYQLHFKELERKYDSSIIFLLAGLNKLKTNGLLGFISSITWQTGENYTKLRKRLIESAGIHQIVNLPFNVFDQAYVDTGIYILSREPNDEYKIFNYPKKTSIAGFGDINWRFIPLRLIDPPHYKIILNSTAYDILRRVVKNRNVTTLGEITISTQGLSGGRFLSAKEIKNPEPMTFLGKGQVYRYQFMIEKTSQVDMSDKRSLKKFYKKGVKLLVRRVINRQDRLMVGITDKEMVFKKDVNPFIVKDTKWNPLYLLGILNSRLISYLYINTSSIATKDDFRQTTLAELRRLPIPIVENDKKQKISKLAENMLELRNREGELKSPHEKDLLTRQIAATDSEIDRLVYELYGLTEEEINIVEAIE
ncbi:MAG TPA: N-6 DNA methylase, partial [bacterium]|nr:N-6 DNA methylase [bacterium]